MDLNALVTVVATALGLGPIMTALLMGAVALFLGQKVAPSVDLSGFLKGLLGRLKPQANVPSLTDQILKADPDTHDNVQKLLDFLKSLRKS